MKPIRLTTPQRFASIFAAALMSACGGGGSGGSSTPANPAPIINMSMSVNTAFTGQTTTLTWSTSNANSCTGTGSWSGTQATSGSLSINATQVGELSYSLNCSGAGGSTTQTSKLTVTQSPLTLIAGNIGGEGSVDGIGVNARLDFPIGIVRDKDGNLFVTDRNNHVIRKITPAGAVSTYAGQVGIFGSSNGEANKAKFNEPSGLAIDASGNLYVADSLNNTIRKISTTGIVTTIAGRALESGSSDGIGSTASFNYPTGIAIDSLDNLYVADKYNNAIRRISSSGQVTTIAGSANAYGFLDGSGQSAKFRIPSGIAIDHKNIIYVADTNNNAIRKIDANGNVSTIKSEGDKISRPYHLQVLSNGDIIFSERANHVIKKLASNLRVSTIAGQANKPGIENGTAMSSKFYVPMGIANDDNGNLYITEFSRIRKIAANGEVSTIAGSAAIVGAVDGIGSAATFQSPRSIVADRSGNLFVADRDNHTIRKISPDGQVKLFAGTPGEFGDINGQGSTARLDQPTNLAIDSSDNLYITGNSGTIRKITPQGVVSHVSVYNYDHDFYDEITVDIANNIFSASSNGCGILKIPQTGTASSFAGGDCGNRNGSASQAQIGWIRGMVHDAAGNLYVADSSNHNIRKITPSGIVTNFAGSSLGLAGSADGAGINASFSYPDDLTIDKVGNLFVADIGNRTIRKITPEGIVSTVAGTPQAGNVLPHSIKTLSTPWGITIDKAGKFYVVMDQGVFLLHF